MTGKEYKALQRAAAKAKYKRNKGKVKASLAYSNVTDGRVLATVEGFRDIMLRNASLCKFNREMIVETKGQAHREGWVKSGPIIRTAYGYK